MASVGNYLRELRQRRGLSLEELSRATRVAPRYLEALEADRFSALPAPVFTRGFIRAYCQAVGASADEALAHYDGREGAATTLPRPTVTAPAPTPTAEPEPRSRSTVLISFVLVVVLGIALFTVAMMTQPAREDRAERRPPASADADASAPPTTEPLPQVAAPAPSTAPASPPATSRATSATPAPQSSTAAPPSSAAPTNPTAATNPAASTNRAAPARPAASTSPAAPTGTATAEAPRATPAPAWLPDVQAATGGVASPYRLVARVSEATWIRVRTEDGRSTEETIPAGQIREWVSNRPFVLTLGNAGGVTLELNGRTLPPLGPSGAVVSRIVLPPQ
jgi:cytoskeleton protein RodZ